MNYSFAIIEPKYPPKKRSTYGLIALITYLGLTVTIGVLLLPFIFQFVSNEDLLKVFLLGYFVFWAISFDKFYSICIDKFDIVGLIEFNKDTIAINKNNTIMELKVDSIKKVKLKGSLGFNRNNTAQKSYVIDFLTNDNKVLTIDITRDLYLNGTFKYKSIFWWRIDLFDVLKKYKIAHNMI